jgi:hypothetical protein
MKPMASAMISDIGSPSRNHRGALRRANRSQAIAPSFYSSRNLPLNAPCDACQCVEVVYWHSKSDAELERDKSGSEGDQDGCQELQTEFDAVYRHAIRDI